MRFKKLIRGIVLSKLGKKVPLRVTQMVTLKCNLDCKYCEYHHKLSNDMDADSIKIMMDEFSKLGTVAWGIGGGEPLTRDDIGEICDYAKRLGFHTSLITNGTLLKRRINDLKNVDMIGVSIDGPEMVNDAFRGNGTYKKALEGLRAAKEAGKKCYINSVISPNNINYLENMVNLAEKMGVMINFQPIFFHKQDELNFHIDQSEYLKNIEELITLKKRGKPIMCSYAYLNLLKGYPDKNPDIKCYAGKMYCFVDNTGIVSPCGQGNYPNGLKLGFDKAFLKLQPYKDCDHCWHNSFVEYNLIYSLDLSACIEAIKTIYR